MKYQKGFAHPAILLVIIVILGVLGIVLYTRANKRNTTSYSETEKTETTPTPSEKSQVDLNLEEKIEALYLDTNLSIEEKKKLYYEYSKFLTSLNCYIPEVMIKNSHSQMDCDAFEELEVANNNSLEDKRVTSVHQSEGYYALRTEDVGYIEAFGGGAKEAPVSFFIGNESTLNVIDYEGNNHDVMAIGSIEYSADIDRLLLVLVGGAHVNKLYMIDPALFEHIKFSDPNGYIPQDRREFMLSSGVINGYHEIAGGKLVVSVESVGGDVANIIIDPETGFVDNYEVEKYQQSN
jgi:hypothetical protein